MSNTPTLSFSSLRYNVSEITQLVANTPGIESFCFCYFFPGGTDSIGLVAYAYIEQTDSYNPDYDTLDVDETDVLTINGPIVMTNNVISIEDVQNLIVNALPDDYLLFIPTVNADNDIFYHIKFCQGTPDGRVRGGGGDDTNPSPPAT